MAIRLVVMLAMLLSALSDARAEERRPVQAPAGVGRVPVGEYVEIDPNDRPNRDFLLVVQEVSPNIVQIRGKNGWVAFASFDADKKEYRGCFEWPNIPGLGRPGGKWADLYQIRMVIQDGVLRIEGKSAGNEMLIRAKSNGEGKGPKVPPIMPPR